MFISLETRGFLSSFTPDPVAFSPLSLRIQMEKGQEFAPFYLDVSHLSVAQVNEFFSSTVKFILSWDLYFMRILSTVLVYLSQNRINICNLSFTYAKSLHKFINNVRK